MHKSLLYISLFCILTYKFDFVLTNELLQKQYDFIEGAVWYFNPRTLSHLLLLKSFTLPIGFACKASSGVLKPCILTTYVTWVYKNIKITYRKELYSPTNLWKHFVNIDEPVYTLVVNSVSVIVERQT